MKNIFSKFTVAGALSLAVLAGVPAAQPAAAAEVEGWGEFKLYLDPGHAGRENQGLWGYSEAEKVLRVALNVREYLQTYTDMPEECIKLCRETDADQISLEERSDEANAWGADFYYSIHSDASANKNTIVTLFGGWMTDGVLVEKTPNGGKAYGEFLNPNLAGVMRVGTRGNRYDRDFYMPITEGSHENQYPYLSVNRRSNMASLLSEGGYHTLAEQQCRNMNDDYKRLEAFAAFQSILQYRGLARPNQTFLTGRVSNSENNQAINGAVITVGDKTYTTDTYESLFSKYTKNPNLIHNGFYLFEGLEAGSTVQVKFEAPGFEPVTKEVTINAGGETSADYVTFLDVELTNASPAKIDAVSVADLTSVSSIYPMVLTFSRNMDRASVEEALTINNNAEYTLTWENDYTLSIDISKLLPLWDYTLTIDGSKARNSQTNQLLDGDADGTEGGDYVLNFTMAEPDLSAPVIMTVYPAEEGEALFTQRPPIRIEFDEIIDWNEDRNAGWFAVKDSKGHEYQIGHVQHSIVAEASVLHCYLAEDLASDVAVLVTLQPVKDLSGNDNEAFAFRFLSEYRAKTTNTVIDPLDGPGNFWAPGGSGSTKGLTEEGNSLDVFNCSPFHGQNSSAAITYSFDPDSPDQYWMIRDHNPKGSNVTLRGKTGIITMWVHGDGSCNKVNLFIRDQTSNGIVKKGEPMVADFRGWNLFVWDLANDEMGHFTGDPANNNLSRKWYLDALNIDHNFGEEGPVFDPEEEGFMAWSGQIGFYAIEHGDWDAEATRTATINDIELPGSGVIAVDTEADIRTAVSGDILNVFAAATIGSVEIFAVDGRLEVAATPDANTASISLAALRSGVHIAVIRTAAGNKSVKIVR